MGSFGTPQAIVTMGFYPQLRNPALAAQAERIALEMNAARVNSSHTLVSNRVKVIVPDDVVQYLTEHRRSAAVFDGEDGTYQYLLLVKRFCEDNLIRTIILVAHEDHYWRSVWVARRLGLDVWILSIKDLIPYDPGVSPAWFRFKEVLKRLLYYFMGRLQ